MYFGTNFDPLSHDILLRASGHNNTEEIMYENIRNSGIMSQGMRYEVITVVSLEEECINV